MLKSLSRFVAFMVILTSASTTFADDAAAKFGKLLARLEKAERIKQHHLQVIEILKGMPNDARELLSLDKMGFNEEGRINLLPVAQADLKVGRINILLAGGFYHPATAVFRKRMEEKYGIKCLDFGLGCMTEPFIRESVEEHNAVVMEFLREKYPKYDVEAEKEWDASVAEHKKNNNSPTRHPPLNRLWRTPRVGCASRMT